MPWLNNIFSVLKDNLDKCSVVSTHDRSSKVDRCTSRLVRDAPHRENTANLEVVCKLEGSVSRDEWHTVNSISLPPIHLSCSILQPDSPSCVNHTIMVRPLRVRPRSTCSQIGSNSTGLVEGPVDLDGGPTRDWTRGWACRVGIVEGTSSCQHWRSETGWNNNVVVLSGLIGCHKHWVRLTHMHIKWGECGLKRVGPLNFHQLHLVTLDTEIERVLKANIRDPEPVCLSCQ